MSGYKESSCRVCIQPRKGQVKGTAFSLSLFNRKQFAEYHKEGVDKSVLKFVVRKGSVSTFFLAPPVVHCHNPGSHHQWDPVL